MIADISIFLFGAISVAIPLLSYHIHRSCGAYVKKCEATRDKLNETLESLNQLHNKAVEEHKSLVLRITKLETKNAVDNYGIPKR